MNKRLLLVVSAIILILIGVAILGDGFMDSNSEPTQDQNRVNDPNITQSKDKEDPKPEGNLEEELDLDQFR